MHELPPDCLVHIAQYLGECDIPNVAVLSKKWRDTIRSDAFSMATYLQQYGPDFWGERVGLHPYTVFHALDSKIPNSY
jgi:hypothetical protein